MLTMGMSILSNCLHIHFGRRECLCSSRQPIVNKLIYNNKKNQLRLKFYKSNKLVSTANQLANKIQVGIDEVGKARKEISFNMNTGGIAEFREKTEQREKRKGQRPETVVINGAVH